MQSSFAQLVRQQLILKGVGYYKGAIDGLWGPLSIEAKKEFERDPTFLPGLPNGGLPFADHKPYPAGISRDNVTTLLYHPVIEGILGEEVAAIVAGPLKRPSTVPRHPEPKSSI